MHVDDFVVTVATISHLFGVHKIPSFISLVMDRVKSLLADVAEVVCWVVRFGALIWDHLI